MAEQMDKFYEDLLDNIDSTSTELKGTSGEERAAIAKTYDMQAKTLISYYQNIDEHDLNKEKLGLERLKFDEEMRLKREIEEARLNIERSKSRNEVATLWTKVALTAVEVGGTIGLGVLYLKANMKYGGMIGKDAQKWFSDLRRIKL